MFDIVDTAFSYERELIVCSFLQDFSKGKGSSPQLICNAHTVFLLCGAELSQVLSALKYCIFFYKSIVFLNMHIIIYTQNAHVVILYYNSNLFVAVYWTVSVGRRNEWTYSRC